MVTAFAWFVLALSLVAWIGQIISAVAPRLAEKLTLSERESEVDSTFYYDGRAECVWDAVCLWPLPVGALLLAMSQPTWVLFGLIGGGMYIYFAGRGIAQRIVLQRRGIVVGRPSTVLQAYVFLALWGVMGGLSLSLASYQLLGALS